MSTRDASPTVAGRSPGIPRSGRRLHGFTLASVLAALMLTLLLESLDQTIVGTAMPKIIGALHGFDRYTWVVTAYLVAGTTMIPVVGKLSDQFGRKWFILSGVVIFLVGSALSGASQTMDELIAFRALQGLGSGFGISLVYTVVGDIFAPAERARWQGVFAGLYGFSSVVGPTVGGWLSDHGPLVGNLVTDSTRWRWVFYVNLPLGLVALLALLVFLPANLSARQSRVSGWAALGHIDFRGAALSAAATTCLLLGLSWGGNQTYAWESPQVLGSLGAAVVFCVLFLLAERSSAEPILPLDLFRNQVFAADAGLALASGMVLLSLVVYLPLYLQGVLGESATNSGEVITPLTVSLVVGAALAGMAIARFGRYQGVTIAGALVLTVGVFLLTRLTPDTSILFAGLAMVIAGVGLGVFFPVVTLAVQNALPRRQMGVGTGAMNFIRAVGQALGVAIVGTVVNNSISSDVLTRIPPTTVQRLTPQGLKFATDPQILVSPTYRETVIQTAQQFALAAARGPAGVPTSIVLQQTQSMLDQVFSALRTSLAVGIQHGMVAALVFCVGVLAASFFLIDVPLAEHLHEEGGVQQARPAQETEISPSARQ